MHIIGKEEAEAAARVIESGKLFRYGEEGGEAAQFEKEWAERLGVNHSILLTSGTAALICGLVGLDVGPGDEVIIPGYTFMATALAALAVGAVPIIVEIDETLGIDPVEVERAITPRTKAIIPVHMVGMSCNMDAIMAIAKKHNVKVLEDACQAVGGSYKGKSLGSIGEAGGFSFNYFKVITCGEGGAVVMNDIDIYERALIHHDGGCIFRSHAREISWPFFAGQNYRTNEISAAIMRVQLGRLDGILAKLRMEKRMMVEELSCIKNLKLSPMNDFEGDCGVTTGLIFETEDRANGFKAALETETDGIWQPINSGRHVYCNWEPVMDKSGAHHPGRDAYKLAKADVNYSPDMCPKTLSILTRTVLLDNGFKRTESEMVERIAKVKKVAAKF
ncbi:MAG: DegT/DnrJ/EryC1/StrS family aminotransferase [bacterium]